MYSEFANNQQPLAEQAPLNGKSNFADTDSLVTQVPYSGTEPTRFQGRFQDSMEMYAEAERVAAYLDAHQDWFSRCAHPMKVEPIGRNAYTLVIGRFGAFGYDVEPKVGLELLPQEDGIYRIHTVPVPDYVTPGYEVDFQATQSFVEVPVSDVQEQERNGGKLAMAMTRVDWVLDLTVAMYFPKFIQKLPQSLIQSTGDRILHQVVRQVSRRLTHKVQEDFHTSMGIPMPKKLKKR